MGSSGGQQQVAHREPVDARQSGEFGARVVELCADAAADDRHVPALREARHLRERVRADRAHNRAERRPADFASGRAAAGREGRRRLRRRRAVRRPRRALAAVEEVHGDHRRVRRRAIDRVDARHDADARRAAHAVPCRDVVLEVAQSDVGHRFEHLRLSPSQKYELLFINNCSRVLNYDYR